MTRHERLEQLAMHLTRAIERDRMYCVVSVRNRNIAWAIKYAEREEQNTNRRRSVWQTLRTKQGAQT